MNPATTSSGATLTEVLMAILVMGIGVVAAATLFPLAIMRSINATKLTQGTILRYNAESRIDMNPVGLVHDPDGTGNILPQQFWGTRYVVDPLGAWLMNTNTIGQLRRFPGADLFGRPFDDNNVYTQKDAENLVSLPDSWIDVVVSHDVGVNHDLPNNQSIVTINDAQLDDAVANISGVVPVQVIVVDEEGRHSARRLIDGTNNFITLPDQITLQPVLRDHDDHFRTITQVRVQSQERQFTWMLTVRHQNGPSANVDVVVFFRRTFDPTEEQPFDVAAVPGSPGQFIVALGPSGEEPFLKDGNYLLDVENAFWYRYRVRDASQRIIQIEGRINAPLQRAAFMRGIVEVYPIKPK